MTNRTYNRPYSAGMAIKKPRLRRLELFFDGPPPTPEGGLNNGIRPHGGVRGSKNHPPGQYSFNKDEEYQNELSEEYQLLVNNEITETHNAPYWLSDIQREITHSGESPLFTSKLLSPNKFEQEHGINTNERAVLSHQNRRFSAPRRRHINGKKEYYRPNSTHQYLSATDLRNLHENEEIMIKYGRPTRTTLLRARQRTGSAPVNAYDTRRETSKRIEDVRNNSIFYTSKEFYNIYAQAGETMHSFLTGARYNRAHLLDSRGLSVYGVYMPRENPAECFITGNRRIKDGEEIPVAPPDSPRSDLDDTPTPLQSRPTSSKPPQPGPASSSRPNSNYSRPVTRSTSSRPQSYRKTPPRTPGSRPRSAKDNIPTLNLNTRQNVPKPPEGPKREPLPDEITMAMPEHINKAGKAGLYVTLKGQKMIEHVDSKLPRVTGVSFPKLRKSRDNFDEILLVNQPPPTPVDVSVASADKHRIEQVTTEEIANRKIDEKLDEVDNEVDNEHDIRNTESNAAMATDVKEVMDDGKTSGVNQTGGNIDETPDISKVTLRENEITETKSMEIGIVKHVNFTEDAVEKGKSEEEPQTVDKNTTDTNSKQVTKDESGNVVFFMTEDDINEKEEENKKTSQENVTNDNAKTPNKTAEESHETRETGNESPPENEAETEDKGIENVISVQISESEKK